MTLSMYKKSYLNYLMLCSVSTSFVTEMLLRFTIEQAVKFRSCALCVVILREGIDGCLHAMYESRVPAKETKIHPLCPIHVVSEGSRIWCRKVYTLTSYSCVIPLPDNGRCLCRDKRLSTRNLVTSFAHSDVESGTTHLKRLFFGLFLCLIEKCDRQNVSTSEFF
jgi:hypothetical protein